MQNSFQPEQYKISSNTKPKDLVDMAFLFLKNHWDDVVIMVVVLTVLFFFVVFTGNRLKPDEDTEKRVMQIIFRSEKKKEKSDEYLENEGNEENIHVDDPKKTVNIEYKHPDKDFFKNN